MEIEILKAGLALFGGLIGATVGAWVGASLTLRRFKQERTFDLLIQWHREAIRAVGEVRNEYYRITSPFNRSESFAVALDALRQTVGEADAFMSGAGDAELQQAHLNYVREIRTTNDLAKHDPDPSILNQRHTLEIQCLGAIHEALLREWKQNLISAPPRSKLAPARR